MGGKKSKSTSKTTADPWIGAQPFLTGAEGTPGVFPESQRLYEQGLQAGNNQAGINQNYGNILNQRANDGRFDAITKGGFDAASGYFSPKINPVQDIGRPDQVSPGMITAQNVDLSKERSKQGFLDPTSSLHRLLGGNVTNQYLDDTANAVTNQIGRNYSENVMPGIRSGAVGAGQYGGSKQAIAEGLALSRMNQDVAQAVAPIYSSAYENAQNRMMGVAGQLNQQAGDIGVGNVNRQFQANTGNVANDLQAQLANQSVNLNRDQFNARLGMQNNAQEFQRANQDLNSRMMGLQALGIGQGLQDQNYANQINLAQQPQNYNWDQLNRYASIITPGAGLGGTSTSSQPNNSNPISGALGGALSGAAMGSIIPGLGTGVGAAVGGGLGLLGGFF